MSSFWRAMFLANNPTLMKAAANANRQRLLTHVLYDGRHCGPMGLRPGYSIFGGSNLGWGYYCDPTPPYQRNKRRNVVCMNVSKAVAERIVENFIQKYSMTEKKLVEKYLEKSRCLTQTQKAHLESFNFGDNLINHLNDSNGNGGMYNPVKYLVCGVAAFIMDDDEGLGADLKLMDP